MNIKRLGKYYDKNTCIPESNKVELEMLQQGRSRNAACLFLPNLITITCPTLYNYLLEFYSHLCYEFTNTLSFHFGENIQTNCLCLLRLHIPVSSCICSSASTYHAGWNADQTTMIINYKPQNVITSGPFL